MMSSMEKIIGYEFRAMAVNERGRPLNMRRSLHGIWFVTFQGALPTFTHYIVVDLVQSVITEPLLNIAIFCNKTDI